jgi:hypothetical protein
MYKEITKAAQMYKGEIMKAAHIYKGEITTKAEQNMVQRLIEKEKIG